MNRIQIEPALLVLRFLLISSSMNYLHHQSPQCSLHQRNPPLSPRCLLLRREALYTISSPLLLLLILLFLNITTSFQPLSFLGFAFPPIVHDEPKHLSVETGTCDYSYGRWVRDESYYVELYSEDCPFLDRGFQCRRNGRKDTSYLNWRWQPYECNLPRFNASRMLEMCRDGRIVFVGDSIGRNQWESLVCMLAKGVQNQSDIYEANGNPITKHKGYLSIRFHDYNLTVEYYRAPFLVVIDRPPPNSSTQVKRAIRVDTMHWQSKRWIGANVLVFNAGHWWNVGKIQKMGNYFQEGKALNMTIDVREGFWRSLQTLKLWVAKNLKRERSRVFFRSYSPSHYSGGTWDNGGQCDANTEPETNLTALKAEPWNNRVISEAIQSRTYSDRMVQFLNITYLTEFRKDGHPSSHREPGLPPSAPEDCSHWCLQVCPTHGTSSSMLIFFRRRRTSGETFDPVVVLPSGMYEMKLCGQICLHGSLQFICAGIPRHMPTLYGDAILF